MFMLSMRSWLFCFACVTSCRASGLNVVRSRIVTELVDSISSAVDEEAGKFASTLQQNGSWPDINYHSQSHGAWADETHVSRLNAMVEAYSYGKILANDTTLWNATRLALDFWLANDFQSPNWWSTKLGYRR